MSRFTTILLLSAALPAQDPKSPQAPKAKPPLEVHEWGTFTSMVGSDGIALEGLQHEEERLPGFVHELTSLAATNLNRKVLKFPASRVTQKMETPVIYFHTDVPRSVSVSVTFKQGILTQFYPIPAIIAPRLDSQLKTPIDLSKVRDGFMQWHVDLIPYGEQPPKEIPKVDKNDPWAFARDVRCAYVRTSDPEEIKRATEAEHYIFYRGLARFTLPMQFRADTDARGAFRNGTKGEVPFAAVLDMDEHGGRFIEMGAVAAGESRDYTFERVERTGDKKRVAAQLGARVFAALIDQGLFEDEARAMIATWSRSWFQSKGTRVIYVLPRAEVERILPLSITPKPEKTVRVLVGRLEYITPETESAVEVALQERVSQDADARVRAEGYLTSLDRFLEPHVRRALARSNSKTVQASARAVLEQIARIER